jgi:hypothetical protein
VEHHLARFLCHRGAQRALEEPVSAPVAFLLEHGEEKPLLAVEVALYQAFGATRRFRDAPCGGVLVALVREGDGRCGDQFILGCLAVPLPHPGCGCRR